MKRTLARFAALLFLAATGAAAPASAAPLLWTIVDAAFDDGGTASGSFVYDADTDSFSAINVTTTAGTVFGGGTYDTLLAGGAFDAALVPGAGDLTGAPLLQLLFLAPLTNDGGVISLVDIFFPVASSFEAQCSDGACAGAVFQRQFIDGALVSSPAVIPVPAAAWLFGGALGALSLVRRRRG